MLIEPTLKSPINWILSLRIQSFVNEDTSTSLSVRLFENAFSL